MLKQKFLIVDYGPLDHIVLHQLLSIFLVFWGVALLEITVHRQNEP